MSIMIFILSNITVLVSQTAMYFGYFISMNDGVNRKAPIFVSTTSPPPPPPSKKKQLQAVVFFSFYEETKFKVDTTSIILKYIYNSGNLNK